jgi:hypothetical protein
MVAVPLAVSVPLVAPAPATDRVPFVTATLRAPVTVIVAVALPPVPATMKFPEVTVRDPTDVPLVVSVVVNVFVGLSIVSAPVTVDGSWFPVTWPVAAAA